jgi:hypothetical protein
MAKDTNINGSGIDGYIVSVRGTETKFVREDVINTEDLVDFEAAKTDAADNVGSQQIDVGGVIAAGTELLGAADGTYTMTVTIDGTAYPVSVDLLLASSDWDALVTAINADLPGTECAIDADDNLTITGTGVDNEAYVRIVDGTLLAALPDFVAVNDPVDGDVLTAMEAQTLDNGANLRTAYEPAVEVYDTNDNYTQVTTDLKTDYTTGDLDIEAEIIAAVNSTNGQVNALSALVQELINRG